MVFFIVFVFRHVLVRLSTYLGAGPPSILREDVGRRRCLGWWGQDLIRPRTCCCSKPTGTDLVRVYVPTFDIDGKEYRKLSGNEENEINGQPVSTRPSISRYSQRGLGLEPIEQRRTPSLLCRLAGPLGADTTVCRRSTLAGKPSPAVITICGWITTRPRAPPDLQAQKRD